MSLAPLSSEVTTNALRSAPAQKRRPDPVTMATLKSSHLRYSPERQRKWTHQRLGSSSNQLRTTRKSSDISGVIALSCLGLLNVRSSTCSAGNETRSCSEVLGTLRDAMVVDSEQ